MKRLFPLVTVLSLGFLTTSPILAADAVQKEGAAVGKWTMDYDAAVKLAGEKKLPVMILRNLSSRSSIC